MSSTPNLIATYKSIGATIGTGNSTRPKRVVVAGASGSRIHQMLLSCTDSTSNTAILYHLQQMTLQSAMGTGALVDGGGGSDTITRTTGSFVTDGWQVGDAVFVHNPTTLANEFVTRLTAVTALTLTFATNVVGTAENLPSGSILYRASQMGIIAVAANAGNSSSVTAVDLLDSEYYPDLDVAPRRYRTLGAGNGIAVAMGSALGAGEYTDVITHYGDY